MDMKKAEMFDKALDMLLGDMDDMEGHHAMSHSMDECSDPLSCDQHEDESGEGLSPAAVSEPKVVEVDIHKNGIPSMDGEKEGDGLSPEDAELLKKLLK